MRIQSIDFLLAPVVVHVARAVRAGDIDKAERWMKVAEAHMKLVERRHLAYATAKFLRDPRPAYMK